MRYDVSDIDKRMALEVCADTLGDLSCDDRLSGAERDDIGRIRFIIDQLLEGER